MTAVRWTEQAAEDLVAIRTFFDRDSRAYAQALVERLYHSVGYLQDFPDIGRVVPERQQLTLRELIVREYRIVYRRGTDVVEILTIFHSALPLQASIG